MELPPLRLDLRAVRHPAPVPGARRDQRLGAWDILKQRGRCRAARARRWRCWTPGSPTSPRSPASAAARTSPAASSSPATTSSTRTSCPSTRTVTARTWPARSPSEPATASPCTGLALAGEDHAGARARLARASGPRATSREGIRFAADHKAQVINMSFEFSLGVNSCGKIKGDLLRDQVRLQEGRAGGRRRGQRERRAGRLSGGRPPCDRRRAGRPRMRCLASDSRTGAGLDLVAPGGGFPLLAELRPTTPCSAAASRSSSSPSRAADSTTFGYPGGYEGTSMAAAHVSGVAALVIASRVVGTLAGRGRVPARGHRPPQRRRSSDSRTTRGSSAPG